MPPVPRIGSTYRQLNRYRQIVSVLAKYGFGDLVDRVRLWEHVNVERRLFHRRDGEFSQLSRAERLRLGLEELGPTFVKLGQVLSTRSDLLSQDYIGELEKLQERVPPFPYEAARQIVESELGRPIGEVFTEFQEVPVAAASLAQVHRATLANGDVVAVKILRPGVSSVIQVDVEIMRSLAVLAERYIVEARPLCPVATVREFAANLAKELDLRTEANHIRRMAYNFADDDTFHSPRVYPELGNRRVLVMEFIDGINVSNVERLTAEGYDLKLIARRGVDIVLRSVFEKGFFHADPHPGNVFILPGNVICFLDYGMMGTVSPRQRESLARLASSIASGDERGMSRSLEGLADAQGPMDVESLEADMSDLAEQYAYLPVSEIRLGEVLNEVMRLLVVHQLRLQCHLVWLFKALGTLEDVAHRLQADFDMIECTKPYAERLMRRRFNPFRQARELYLPALDMVDLVKEFPYAARDVVRQLREGRLKIESEHIGLEPARKTLDHVANRLALSIVIAALVVGSSLVVHAKVPPLVAEISIIGIIGYAIAWAFGVWLMFSILRSGST